MPSEPNEPELREESVQESKEVEASSSKENSENSDSHSSEENSSQNTSETQEEQIRLPDSWSWDTDDLQQTIQDLQQAPEVVMPADQPPDQYDSLFGGTLRTTARSAEEMKKAIVAVLKTKRKTLSTSDKTKLRNNAVEGISPKFTTLKTKPGTEELQNVYSLALLLYSFERECIKYQMEDVFMIVPTDADGNLDRTRSPHNLFKSYKQIDIDEIKASCKTYFEYSPEDYIVENLAWTGEKLLNSCDDDLRQTLQGHSLTFDVHECVGPVYLKVMLDIIFNVSDWSLHALVTRIEKMQLSDYNGENIAKACEFLRSAHLILDNCDFMPPDFEDQLYKFFKTAHSTDFQQQISSLQVMLNIQDEKKSPAFIIDFAEKQYNALVSTGDWDKAASAKGDSVFWSKVQNKQNQNNQRRCYRCGSPDHLANQCPNNDGGHGGRGRGAGRGRNAGRGRGGPGRGGGGNQSNDDDWKTTQPKRGEKTYNPDHPKGFQYWCGRKGCCKWTDHDKNHGPHANEQANVSEDKQLPSKSSKSSDSSNDSASQDNKPTEGMVASLMMGGPTMGTRLVRGFKGS